MYMWFFPRHPPLVAGGYFHSMVQLGEGRGTDTESTTFECESAETTKATPADERRADLVLAG